MLASNACVGVAFSISEEDRHLGIRPVSQLNTQPMASPVNASPKPSRAYMHHSGSGRTVNPYSVEDFHLLSFASFAWRTRKWVEEVNLSRLGDPAYDRPETEALRSLSHVNKNVNRERPREGTETGVEPTVAPARTPHF
jgi:hypothetical protein